MDPFSLLRDATGHLPLLEAIKAGDVARVERTFSQMLEDWLEITRSEFSQQLQEA